MHFKGLLPWKSIVQGLSFNFFAFVLSSVDLSSCSEDDYDSDDSERDLRWVKSGFCGLRLLLVPAW